MKKTMKCTLYAGSIFLAASGFTSAGPTGAQVCSKMISDGRGGNLDQSDCLCNYRAADAVLNDQLKALLFDSWYNGTDNMQKISELPQQGRIRRQFRNLQREIQENCP